MHCKLLIFKSLLWMQNMLDERPSACAFYLPKYSHEPGVLLMTVNLKYHLWYSGQKVILNVFFLYLYLLVDYRLACIQMRPILVLGSKTNELVSFGVPDQTCKEKLVLYAVCKKNRNRRITLNLTTLGNQRACCGISTN